MHTALLLPLAAGFSLGPLPTRPPRVEPSSPDPDSDPIANAFRTKLFRGGQGKRIFFGVFQQTVTSSEIPPEEDRQERRLAAATQLINIDMPERERRKLAGTVFSTGTAALAVGLLATGAPTLTRFAIAPPLFLAYGFLASAKEGL